MAEFCARLVAFVWFTGLTCIALVGWLQYHGDGFYLCMFICGIVVLVLLTLMALQDIRSREPAQTAEDRGNDEPSASPPG
jgi:hypothetical protein